MTQFTDYFVLLNGQIDQHVKAISDHIVDTLKKEAIRPHHVEGENSLKWILIDYIDVIVHTFQPVPRQFYDLESLWIEAERLPLLLEQETEVAPIPAKRKNKAKPTAVKPKAKPRVTSRREPKPST